MKAGCPRPAQSQIVAHKPVVFQVRRCSRAFGVLRHRRRGCSGAAGVPTGPWKCLLPTGAYKQKLLFKTGKGGKLIIIELVLLLC